MHDATQELRRRDLLKRALLIVGGVASVTTLTECFRSPTLVADSEAFEFFSADRIGALSAIVDAILPDTDTPGAIKAGVPRFLDALMASWASAETKARLETGLDAIEAFAIAQAGGGIASLQREARDAVISQFDRQAFAQNDMFWLELKELTLLGYYQSEIGATQELQYELIPGRWVACAPQSEIGRAWAD